MEVRRGLSQAADEILNQAAAQIAALQAAPEKRVVEGTPAAAVNPS